MALTAYLLALAKQATSKPLPPVMPTDNVLGGLLGLGVLIATGVVWFVIKRK